MKLEIEITEAEIKSAIERKVRTAIADQTNQWSTDNYIKERVKSHWQNSVDTMVKDLLENSETLRQKIGAEVERKMRLKVAAVMKATGK